MAKSKLENLIEAAVSDGKLSKKERKLIFEEAKREGYSDEEIEIILDGKLKASRRKLGLPEYDTSGCFKKIGCLAIVVFIILLISKAITENSPQP